MFLHEIHFRVQSAGERNIVGILNGDISAFGEGARCDLGLDITTRGYLAESNSFVFGSITPGDILGFIGRAKVNDNEFKVMKGLIEDTFDRLSQKSLYIANYHHNGNERFIGGWHGSPIEQLVTRRIC